MTQKSSSGKMLMPPILPLDVVVKAAALQRYRRELLLAAAMFAPPHEEEEDEIESEKDEDQVPDEDQPMDLTVGRDEADWREMEAFAAAVKKRRLELGMTQGDVGAALGRMGVADLSQTTISRFEALNLSRRNMSKLRPLLQDWLDGADQRAPSLGESSHHAARRRRRKRTSIDGIAKARLEQIFSFDQRPPPSVASRLAAELGLEREVVRVWFCNRRQKEKRAAHRDEGDGQNHLALPVDADESSSSSACWPVDRHPPRGGGSSHDAS